MVLERLVAGVLAAMSDPATTPSPASTDGALRVNPSVVTQLDALPDIPKKLHMFWPDKDVVNSEDEMVVHGIRKMIDLNPDWSWKVYDHADIDEYIKRELDRDAPVLSASDVALVLQAHIVERTDAARLLIMWHEGGFYQDTDRVYNVPMSEVLRPGVKMVIQTLYNSNFMQDQMCTAPGNPVIKAAIDIAWKMRRAAPRVNGISSFMNHMEMVNSWTTAITTTLFDRNQVNISNTHAAIAAVPALMSHNEVWCDGLWVRPYAECKGISRAALYETYNIHPWGHSVQTIFRNFCDNLRSSIARAEAAGDDLTKLNGDIEKYQCNTKEHGLRTTTKAPNLIAQKDSRVARTCTGFAVKHDEDVSGAEWVTGQPPEGHIAKASVCCGLCLSNSECHAFVVQPSTKQCWLMKTKTNEGISFRRANDRFAGIKESKMTSQARQAYFADHAVVERAPSQALVVDPSLVEKLKALPPIPKKLHVIFPSKDVVNSQDEMVQHGVRRMIDMNPDWTVTVYDHAAVDEYLQKELTRSKPLLTQRDVTLMLKAHIVERTDAVRLLIMWYEGGFYQDVDRVYNVPMDQVLNPEIKQVIPTLYDQNFMQDLMCTAPGNPVIRRAIDVAWGIRRKVIRVNGISNFLDHMHMVNSWSTAISVELFGRADVNYTQAREAIAKVPQLLTYKETWCDGIWIRPYAQCRSISRVNLYAAYNMTPWGEVVKAVWRNRCTKIEIRRAKVDNMQSRSKMKTAAMARLESDFRKFLCAHEFHRTLMPKKP